MIQAILFNAAISSALAGCHCQRKIGWVYRMNFLEKFRNKLVHFLFPFIERFFLVIALVLMVSIWFAWSVPQPHSQTRAVLVWLTLVYSQIYRAGVTERDCLPLQPGSGPLYRSYRFIDRVFFLFFLIWLLLLLIPVPLWVSGTFAGAFVAAVILRTIGDLKYRPKKPEE